MRRFLLLFATAYAHLLLRKPSFDVVLRNGRLRRIRLPPAPGGVAINADTIAKTGDVAADRGRIDIDVHGQVISPGFINMMSGESAFADGRGLSDLRQGVTLEIFGEGESMGPLNDGMRAEQQHQQSDIKYDITWRTLAEGLDTLARRGVSPNIASFIGAATPRVYALGRANRAPSPAELDQMRALTAKAMEDGALGVASALPNSKIARTAEPTPPRAAAGERRSRSYPQRGDHELEAIDELIAIARQARIPAEICHLKVSGAKTGKSADILRKIEAARAEGLQITADMYTYPAPPGSTPRCPRGCRRRARRMAQAPAGPGHPQTRQARDVLHRNIRQPSRRRGIAGQSPSDRLQE
jgi:N-acyl-D-amino-acid deacylase